MAAGTLARTPLIHRGVRCTRVVAERGPNSSKERPEEAAGRNHAVQEDVEARSHADGFPGAVVDRDRGFERELKAIAAREPGDAGIHRAERPAPIRSVQGVARLNSTSGTMRLNGGGSATPRTTS